MDMNVYFYIQNWILTDSLMLRDMDLRQCFLAWLDISISVLTSAERVTYSTRWRVNV